MRGRPRKPTKIHYLNGLPGKRKPPPEPEPEVRIPEPPGIIQGVALEEWHRITKELLALSLIAEINRSMLAAYCKAYADWVEAEIHWDTETKIFKTDTGYPVLTPWRSVADKAFERMCKVATGFGMDPASMSRIKAPPKKKEKEKGAARFLA